MSNVRSIPTPAKNSATREAVALLETKLALLTLLPIASAWKNFADMTIEQRLSDYTFRLGYLTHGLEEMSRRLQIYEKATSPPPTTPAATVKEPDRA